MNRILELKKQDNTAGIPTPLPPSDSFASCAKDKLASYHSFVKALEGSMQSSVKTRANYKQQDFIFKRKCDDNNYIVFLDGMGVNIINANEPIEPGKVLGTGELTWSDRLRGTKIAEKVQLGLSHIIGRLKKFGQLERGWDSYGAEPIEWDTIARAIEFSSRIINESDKGSHVFFVAPLSDGGIQFEWRTLYKELVITIPKNKEEKITYLKVEKSIFGEEEEEGETVVVNDAVDLATTWLLS